MNKEMASSSYGHEIRKEIRFLYLGDGMNDSLQSHPIQKFLLPARQTA